MPEPDLPLLNIFEVQDGGKTRHLVGFLDTILAGAIGIPSHAMVGDFDPDGQGEFDPQTFRLNPEFVTAVTAYMNGGPSLDPGIAEQAAAIPGQWLYVVDPRNTTDPEEDPPPADVLGCYAVDEAGQVVPKSFQYNKNHRWFDPEAGVSGMLVDRRFYEFVHPRAARQGRA